MASTVSFRPVRSALGGGLAAALVAGLVLLPTGASGQDLQADPLLEPLVPGGYLRLGFSPSFASWDTRFGLEDGVDVEEPLAGDLESETGTDLFPGVALLAADLEALTGEPLPPFSVGETRGTLTQDVTRLDFSAHLGVFDWLTLGATLPWVRTRTAADLYFRADPDANLGLTPGVTDNEAANAYVQAVLDAATAAEARAASVCGAGSGSDCQSAQALAERAGSFAGRVQRLYFISPFFPLAGTGTAQAFEDASASLGADLAAAGLETPGAPVFATETVDAETFASLSSQAAAGIQGSAIEDRQGLWQAGDVELEATLRLLDGEVRDSGAASPTLAWTLAGGALVRLGTGTPDDVDVFLDQGSGDGQMDVEAFGYGAFRAGSRLALRGMARYGIQQSTRLLRRVAAHEAIFPPATTRRTVEWTPGRYLDLTLSPRIHVNESLALAVDYRLFHKGSDSYRILGDQGTLGLDASLLERETEVTAHQVSVGLRYSTLRLWRRGETDTPLELAGRVVQTVQGSGGQTPKRTRGELSIRLYRNLWGG